LEKTQHQHQRNPHPDSPEVLILDRGLFDALIWLGMMEHLARIKKEDRERVEQFLLMEDWRKRISGVIVMTASPEHSMAREKGDLPVEGARGSIMNEQWLSQFKDNIRKTCKRLEKEFRVFPVDTSQKEEKDNRKRTAQKVAGIVLDLIAEQLEEDILCAPKAELVALFSGKAFLVGKAAEAVASHFVHAPRPKAQKICYRRCPS
jgi:hypothetical protein